MATIERARAIGLGEEIGSLEAGKQANLILVNLTPVPLAPARNIVPNLVYAGSGHEVKTAMVAGKVLVRNGEVQAEQVARLVAADPVRTEMALSEAMEARHL